MPGFVSQQDITEAGGLTAAALPASTGVLVAPLAAAGDGVTDDTVAVVAASNAFKSVLLPAGKDYLVGTCTINRVVSMGGTITVNSPNTLTILTARSNSLSRVIFKGTGRVIIKDRYASAGWYDGTSLTECHNFWRRGQAAVAANDVSYEYTIPTLASDDPRATTINNNTPAWKLTGPLQFDDPENQGVIHCLGFIKAMNVMDYMIEYSPIRKTEQIEVPISWKLYGDKKAKNAIMFHGGARIKHGMRTTIKDVTEAGILQAGDLFACDEIEFDFVDVTGFGTFAYDALNRSTNNSANTFLKTQIRTLFTNGGAPGCQGLVRVAGSHRGFKIHEILENALLADTVNFGDWSGAMIQQYSVGTGTPRYVQFGTVQMVLSTKSVIATYDSAAGATTKMTSSVDRVFRGVAVGTGLYNYNLAYLSTGDFGRVNEGADARIALVAPTCASVSFTGNRRDRIDGNCDYMKVDGVVHLVIPSLDGTTTDPAVLPVFTYKFDPAGRVGPITIHTNNAGMSANGVLINGAWQGYKGANTDVGTTDAGTAGNLSVVLNGGTLTLTNRSTNALTTLDVRMTA